MHARDGARTHDHKVKSLALYRLSYPGPVVSDVLPSEARLIVPSQHALQSFSAVHIRCQPQMLSHLCSPLRSRRQAVISLLAVTSLKIALDSMIDGCLTQAWRRADHSAWQDQHATSVATEPSLVS